jgi:hypothetical protein
LKLRLKDSNEEFDAPRGIGLALISIGEGKIEQVPPSTPGVIRPEDEIEAKLAIGTQWTWGSSKTKGREILQASCPRCHNGISFASDAPNALATLKRGFFHCGKPEQAPEDKFDLFVAAVTSAEKVRKTVKEIQDKRQRARDEDARAGQSILHLLN